MNVNEIVVNALLVLKIGLVKQSKVINASNFSTTIKIGPTNERTKSL